MESKVADILIPFTWKLTRFGEYITRKAGNWRLALLIKYNRI